MKLFEFDEVDGRLSLMPIAARRALDVAGLRLSLDGWRSLTHSDREAIVRAGSEALVDTPAVHERVRAANPEARAMTPELDVCEDTAPEELKLALGPTRPVHAKVWAGLSPLERYALFKAARSKRRERLERAYSEIVGHSAYSTHLSPRGGAHMVRISEKAVTLRRAAARSQVSVSPAIVDRLLKADVPKGDVLGTARLAGILAAKRTPDWIPLCHPVRLTHVAVLLDVDRERSLVRITAEVEAEDRTGVEMEALVAASAAALTVYDMLKGFDRSMVIGPTELVEKSGGQSGNYQRDK